MINNKQTDECREFKCGHELHEDCINAFADEIDEWEQLHHTQERYTVQREQRIRHLREAIQWAANSLARGGEGTREHLELQLIRDDKRKAEDMR
jgi:hypothetical protein